MIRTFIFATILLLAASIETDAKGRDITLGDITSGEYRPQTYSGVTPMLDPDYFTCLSNDKKSILRYSFTNGEVIDTLFNTTTARGADFKTIDGYIFSPDESRILVHTNTNRIYRHSFMADYHIFSRKNNKLQPLSTGGAQQSPIFSPDGNSIAFARDNNLFLVKLLFDSSESQITTDGKQGEIINGIPDWVYEEEFATNRSFDFSADSKVIAYVRYDESNVPTYEIPMYIPQGKQNKEYDEFKKPYIYKYPVAGAENSKVSVRAFDIKSRVTRKFDLPIEADAYIPRIQFTQDPNTLAVMTLNRHQNQLNIYAANPLSGLCKLIIREESDTYISAPAYNDIRFYKNNIILQSQRNGFNHLYLYTIGGNLVKQITEGSYEVGSFLGWDEKSNTFYYTSNEGNPIRQGVYKIDAKTKKSNLTQQEGINSPIFGSDMKYFINTYQSLNTPPIVTTRDNNGTVLKTLIDNKPLTEKLKNLNMPQKELFSFTTSSGVQLNGWMMKPSNFDSTKKYPIIMHQYSGPYSQSVKDSWSTGFYGGGMWEGYLNSKGFIVVCVDGRGTGGRGTAFGKSNYMALGTLEAIDQVEAAKYLGTLPYVDKNNIGIWGWSYGGYNTLMSMSQGTPVFKAGVAIAPPTDWRFYDTVYTERYMRTPKENKTGYDKGSAIENVDKLNGKLLLIHGMADDNVHFRNIVRYMYALTQADVQFESQIYPDSNHSIYFGSNTRNHLLERISTYFIDNLR